MIQLGKILAAGALVAAPLAMTAMPAQPADAQVYVSPYYGYGYPAACSYYDPYYCGYGVYGYGYPYYGAGWGWGGGWYGGGWGHGGWGRGGWGRGGGWHGHGGGGGHWRH